MILIYNSTCIKQYHVKSARLTQYKQLNKYIILQNHLDFTIVLSLIIRHRNYCLRNARALLKYYYLFTKFFF